MPAPATRCRTGRSVQAATPIAGPGRTAAGLRCRRMFRGEKNLSTCVVPANAGTHTPRLLNGVTPVDVCLRYAQRWLWVPARASLGWDDANLSIKHDDAAHRLAGIHRGKAFVDLGQFQLRRNPVLEMQLA